MANYSKIEKLKVYLQNEHSLKDIANHLDVSVRTAYRYIETLKEELLVSDFRGLNLYKVKAEEQSLISLTELDTLEKSIQKLADQGDIEASSQMKELVKRLQTKESNSSAELNLLEPNQYFEIINGPFSSSRLSSQSKSVQTLQRAMEESKTVKIRYHSLGQYIEGKTGKITEVAPYKIVLRSGRLYLIAKPVKLDAEQSPRIYLFSRIQQIQSTSKHFVIPSKINIDDFYKYTFGQWAVQEEEAEKVVLYTKEAWLKRHIEESHFNPKAKIVAAENGGWDINLELYLTGDFISWLVGNTPELYVKEPQILREKVQAKRKA